jgi:Subtilase family
MPRQRAVEISVDAHEVLVGPRRLEVRAPAALEPETARAALALKSARATVALSDNGRTATLVPEDELPTGPHTLIVGELVSTRGKRLSERVEIPFFVSDSRAKVDAALRVESIVRLQVERLGTTRVAAARRPDGRFIELLKAVNRRSGRPVGLAFDDRGAPIEANEVFAKIRRAREAEFGKLHPTLARLIAERSPEEIISVAVWLRLPDEELPAKREKGHTAKPPRSEAAQAKQIAEAAQRVTDLLREHGAKEPQPALDVPVVHAELPAERVRKLAQRDEVGVVFFYDKEAVLDLSNSMKIAQSDTVQSSLSLNGAGVNIAIYEDGPDDTTNLSITASFLSNPAMTQHSRHTHGIVKNVEPNKPHGHASGCNLHSANSADLDAISWAARTRGCTVISQSFHRDAEQTDAGLSYDDMYKDWLVLHWPYPTILQAAGNGSSTEYVNHKGYNSLTVANHDDTASALAGDSVFRNPASAHSDRELAELSANGTAVTAVGLTFSGTSMAAPAAAGCTALLQEANATLKSWPEGCRAIVLAGASKNITGNTWWTDRSAGVDASDGSGAVDALESVRIAKSRRSPGSPGTRRGWDVGTLRSSDIGSNGETTFSWQVTVPRYHLDTKVKVALAWDSLATVVDLSFFQFAFDDLQVDLDLKVYNSSGALVGYSGSWDNSYEIAEFAARAGETYTIKIRRWSGTADVWYGLAWTVQGTPFVRPNWDLTERIVRLAER